MSNKHNALIEQDQHIEDLVEITKKMHQSSLLTHEELQRHKKIGEDLERHMDKNLDKMDFVQKKLSVLLKTEDKSQIKTICTLSGILSVLVFLVLI
jgi:phosphoenolpyruvate synthase/pyruvate phosphate dikinase